MIKNIRSSFKEYLKYAQMPVELKLYLKISADYCKFLCEKVLQGHKVTLPARMGTLSIVGRKQEISFDEKGNIKGLAPDWVKTKEYWEKDSKAKEEKKLIYHTNPHSEGYIYRFFWSKKNVLVENKSLYSLRMTRTNKREVNKRVKKGKNYSIKY